MSETSWEDVVELPDELDDETAEELYEGAAEIQAQVIARGLIANRVG